MKILFLGPIKSSFAKNDIEILQKDFELSIINSSTGRGIKGIFNLMKCIVLSTIYLIKSDVVFSWFADYTSLVPVFLAKLFKKKSIVIAGGFDVGYQPQLNYGAIMKPIRWFCVRNTFKYADKIIPVSNYAAEALMRLTGKDYWAKTEVIYNGIKSEKFSLPENENRNIFLTVSQAHSDIEFKLKGSDTFIKIAAENPNYEFKLVGLRGEALNEAKKMAMNIKNIEVIEGPLNLYTELIPLYQKSFAYIQLSIEESFGVAVVEAMKCGCVPIISNNSALPEISGKFAKIINTPSDITSALQFSVEANITLRTAISNYSETFDIKYREEKLLNLINNLL